MLLFIRVIVMRNMITWVSIVSPPGKNPPLLFASEEAKGYR
jgi:hypothetical protein